MTSTILEGRRQQPAMVRPSAAGAGESTFAGRIRRLGLSASLSACLLAVVSNAAAGEIERPIGIVELFTSQGCSSCPPADETLATLIEEGDVVALAYHVDYWDRLGWVDTFGSRQWTQRQYDYARSFHRRGVYTPQAVINGRTHVVGSHVGKLRSALATHQDDFGRAELAIERDGDRAMIELKEIDRRDPSLQLIVTRFEPAVEVEIGRGENAGHSIAYHHAVIDQRTLPLPEEGEIVNIHGAGLILEEGDGIAAFVQSYGEGGIPGPIIGAAISTP